MNDAVRARIDVQHSPDCRLKDDPAPFVMYEGIDWNLNKNATGKGSHAFYRFRCNWPSCPAIVRVNIVALSDWIGAPE